MPGSTLFESTDTAKTETPAGLLTLINGRRWEELIIRYLECPKSANIIKNPSYKAIWERRLEELMPDTWSTSSEGQLEDKNTRHPFDILAGKFCAYKGWSSRKKSEGPDSEWLERGVKFGDYLCCDRLCQLAQTNPEPSDEDLMQIIDYATVAANHHGSIGYGLLAETHFRIGTYFKAITPETSIGYDLLAKTFVRIAEYFKRLKPEASIISACFQLAAQNMIIAVQLQPISRLITEQACYVHSRKTRFEAKANKKMDLSWERDGATLEETQRAMVNISLDYISEPQPHPLPQPS